jgi:hypothetical protein
MGVVVYACNPSTWGLRQDDGEFEASLGYIIRLPQTKQNKTKQNKTKQNIEVGYSICEVILIKSYFHISIMQRRGK